MAQDKGQHAHQKHVNLGYVILLYFTSQVRGHFQSTILTDHFPSISFPIGFLTWFGAHPTLTSSCKILHFQLNALNTPNQPPLFQLSPYLLYIPSPTLTHKTPTLYTSLSLMSNCQLSLRVPLSHFLVFLFQPFLNPLKCYHVPPTRFYPLNLFQPQHDSEEPSNLKRKQL